MLPFTTYQIPESEQSQTATPGQWLLLAVPKPLSDSGKDLLHKIATALKADFARHVLLLEIEQGQTFSLSELKSGGIELLIGFGVHPADLGVWIDLENYGVRQLEGLTVMYTMHPDKLAEHAGAKKDLWRHMQLFLEIKTTHAR